MDIKKECYLIYYRQKKDLKRIKQIVGLDIYYISQRAKYLTVYLDKKDERRIKNELRKLKGVRSFEPSLLNQPSFNASL